MTYSCSGDKQQETESTEKETQENSGPAAGNCPVVTSVLNIDVAKESVLLTYS